MSGEHTIHLPKLVITDIDGVWTDGGMYYDQQGNEWKKFNTSDSAGVLFLQKLGIPLLVLTGENTSIVERRMAKLKIQQVFQGVENKLKKAKEIVETMGIDWSEVAFIGDDLNDLELLQVVGISACPANAPDYIKAVCKRAIPVKGGDGAFRSFIEGILMDSGHLQEAIDAVKPQA